MAAEHFDYSKISYNKNDDWDDVTLIDLENLLRQKDQVNEFRTLMMKYDSALLEVRTKLDVLNKELSLRNNRNPFEAIKMRIKTPLSIYKKLNGKGVDFSIENIDQYISDVAGIRVVCSFVDDIYMLADCLANQDDIRVLQRKDYIDKPKKSGYRSLHLIIEVPIFLVQEKEYMKVEVQFRTIAMDFWASLEHQLRYKNSAKVPDSVRRELFRCAETIAMTDREMEEIAIELQALD